MLSAQIILTQFSFMLVEHKRRNFISLIEALPVIEQIFITIKVFDSINSINCRDNLNFYK